MPLTPDELPDQPNFLPQIKRGTPQLTQEEQSQLEMDALAAIHESLSEQAGALAEVGSSVAETIGTTLNDNQKSINSVSKSINGQSSAVLDKQVSALGEVVQGVNSSIESTLAEQAVKLGMPGPMVESGIAYCVALFDGRSLLSDTLASFRTLEEAKQWIRSQPEVVIADTSDDFTVRSTAYYTDWIGYGYIIKNCTALVGSVTTGDSIPVDEIPVVDVPVEDVPVSDDVVTEGTSNLDVSPSSDEIEPVARSDKCCPFPVDWDQPLALAFSGVADPWMDKVIAYYPQVRTLVALKGNDGIDLYLKNGKPSSVSKPDAMAGDSAFGDSVTSQPVTLQLSNLMQGP